MAITKLSLVLVCLITGTLMAQDEKATQPEAQVTQKGDIALRGGILDAYPLTSPWPVRLEFFGDELESLRHFDPITQISREEITAVTLPPGGELGILKRIQNENNPGLATLLELEKLYPVLDGLAASLEAKGKEFHHIMKSGRTHMQDAVPMRLGQEFAAYGVAIRKAIATNKPYLIDVDIAADINPSGAGVWELPGLGQSKPGIGFRYEPT